MHFDEKETALLKTWIIKKLEDISDADSDVLADYVLALAGTEDPKTDAKPVEESKLIDNLKDFLNDSTEPFVRDLVQAISTKSYDPSKPQPKPAAPIYHPPKRYSYEQPRLPNESRKRSYHDWDREADSNGQLSSFQRDERPVKHLRRGGRGYDHRGGRSSFQPHHYGVSQQSPMPHMSMPPPGIPPLDPNNPMASMLALQNAMEIFAGSMQNGAPQPNGNAFKSPRTAQRCRDYDMKGFCAAGASCPYDHGEDSFMIPGPNQEYDPNDSTLLNIAPTRVGHVNTDFSDRRRGGARGRGRGRGSGNFRGGGKRSDFSQMGPSRDWTNTTIVVEQIPQEYCDEKSVRAFFEEFGGIEEITVHPDKKLATIKYESHDAAQNAYESPKVVFENRFVKIYWHKPAKPTSVPSTSRTGVVKVDTEVEDSEMHEDGQVNLDELAKRQEEAQRKQDEAKRQREQTEAQRQDVQTKLRAIEDQKKKLAADIVRKTGSDASSADEPSKPINLEDSEQTRLLKAQLAKLEAEAKSLGIDPDVATNGYNSYSTGRGRGGYRGRGRGRGSYRGYRGGWAGANGGAVMRLDNRPKTVAVTFAKGSYDSHEEALRQFLLFNNMDSASLAKHPDRDDTALITFEHRYQGETFMDTASNAELLHVGKVELSWHKGSDKVVATNGNHPMEDVKNETAQVDEQASSDVEIIADYEVAEEEDLDRFT